jgi:hypothetical protein
MLRKILLSQYLPCETKHRPIGTEETQRNLTGGTSRINLRNRTSDDAFYKYQFKLN